MLYDLTGCFWGKYKSSLFEHKQIKHMYVNEIIRYGHCLFTIIHPALGGIINKIINSVQLLVIRNKTKIN